jgi:Rrf2 family iron-sulfur cluster assembly transcriptional regulator
MRLTTKGRFAVTAMIDVAMHNGEGPVTLAGVANRQKISLSYLGSCSVSVRAGRQRARTEYSLARPATPYRWRTSLPRSMSRSMRRSAAARELRDDKRCMTHELWANLNTHILRS